MTVTREEKVYRTGVEKRIGSLEEMVMDRAVEDVTVSIKPPDLSDLVERVKHLTQETNDNRPVLKKLGEDWREHELELYGQGNGNGLTRRLERVEERVGIVVDEIWWIRKGVLIVLILTLLSLGQIWWRFGW